MNSNKVNLGRTSLEKLDCLVRFGRYAEAAPSLERLLHAHNTSSAADQPENNTSLKKVLMLLGMCKLKMGRIAEAEQLFERLLSFVEDSQNPATIAIVLRKLAHCKIKHGRHAEAGKLLERLLNAYMRVHGPDHEDVVGTMDKLASCTLLLMSSS